MITEIFKGSVKALVDFYTSPVKSIEGIEKTIRSNPGYMFDELSRTCLMYIRAGRALPAENHTVEEGHQRIRLLFVNELKGVYSIDGGNVEEKDEIIISTDRLDPKLYDSKVVENIAAMATRKPVRVIFKESSGSIERLHTLFKNTNGSVAKLDKEELLADWPNFIITSNAYSEEKLQEYKNGELDKHEATFYYNTRHLKRKEVVGKIRKEKQDFNQLWETLTPLS